MEIKVTKVEMFQALRRDIELVTERRDAMAANGEIIKARENELYLVHLRRQLKQEEAA